MNKPIPDEVYRYLFENSFDALFLTSTNGSVFRANPAACEMLQRTEEEICKLGRNGLVDVNDPQLDVALKQRLENGKVRAEVNFIRKDQSIVPTEVSSAIFRDDYGEEWTVIIVHDMTMIKAADEVMRKAQEESVHFATFDYLTGILNRRAFMDKLYREGTRSKREATPFSIILLDIDHFKRINDRMSHSCGDAALKRVASLLAEKLRPYDTLGRYGGDEFIILLPNTTASIAHVIAERLRSHIEDSRMECEHHAISMTISAGLACHDTTTDEDIEALIVRADKNLYVAKRKRNSVAGQ